MRANPAVAPPRATAMSSASPLRAGLEPLVRSLPARARGKQDDDLSLSFLKSFGVVDEFQPPEALQQSVACGARFVIQHLPPLEGLPALPARMPVAAASASAAEPSDELPDLAAAAHSLELAQDSTCKPHISFSGLIAMAILDAPGQRRTVGEIYEWIKQRYPYYATAAAGVGWKNSIRHNLSLNRHFAKKTRDDDSDMVGKGAYWCVRPESLPQLEAAIIKQAKVYQRMGGGLAAIAGLSLDLSHDHADDRGRRPAVLHGRRADARELSSSDAAATLVALTNAAVLPAVKSQAGAMGRARSVVVRAAGSAGPGSAGHSATMRYFPDGAPRRQQADALSTTLPSRAAVARGDAEDTSPLPGPDEGIGATPDMSPRKRCNSGTLYTFSAQMSQLDGSVRAVPDGRRSPPHARRRLTLRGSMHEEQPGTHSEALAASAALMSLAALAADSHAMPATDGFDATACGPTACLAVSTSPLGSATSLLPPHSPASALSPVPELTAPSPPAADQPPL